MEQNQSFIDILNTCLRQKSVSPPVFNRIGLQLQQMVATKEADIREIEKLITHDQTLTSQVLRIANSGFYRGISEIKTVHSAIVRLGLKEIAKIALMASQRGHFTSNHKKINSLMQRLWRHSVACAIGARWIADNCAMEAFADEAFTAGLLHDIGKLYILHVTDALLRSNKIAAIPFDYIFSEALDELHTEYGYALLTSWNVPEKYAEIARDHHQEQFDLRDDLAIIVRLADIASNQLGIGLRTTSDIIIAATAEADRLAMTDVKIAQLIITLEDSIDLAM